MGIILLYAIPFKFLFDKNDITNSLKDIVPILTCITAAISALFSGISITLSIKQRYEDNRTAIFTRWYNVLILDKHVNNIEEFYSICEDLIDLFEEYRIKKKG